jgi:hypothetical protein
LLRSFEQTFEDRGHIERAIKKAKLYIDLWDVRPRHSRRTLAHERNPLRAQRAPKIGLRKYTSRRAPLAASAVMMAAVRSLACSLLRRSRLLLTVDRPVKGDPIRVGTNVEGGDTGDTGNPRSRCHRAQGIRTGGTKTVGAIGSLEPRN